MFIATNCSNTCLSWYYQLKKWHMNALNNINQGGDHARQSLSTFVPRGKWRVVRALCTSVVSTCTDMYCRHGLHLFVFEFCILSVREKMIACSSVLSRTILLSQTSISLLVLRFVHAIFPVFTTEALIWHNFRPLVCVWIFVWNSSYESLCIPKQQK